MGTYADPVATKLMNASTSSPSASAISAEVKYFAQQYPVFYMPDQDWIMVISNKIGGPSDAFTLMTQQSFALNQIWVNK